MTVVVASDLDRTLVYSRQACRLGLPDTAPDPDVVCVEVYDGAPSSFVTPAAAGLLTELATRALLVPTTTRTREQYARITLPGPAPGHAVCANGGHIVVDGAADLDWHAAVRKRLDAGSAPLGEIVSHLEAVADPAWARKLRVAEDLFAYLVLERAALPGGFVTDLTGWAGERGWGVSLQGRKLYLVPDALTKGAAVREVARRTGADLVLAAGDSLLDIELLLAADHGVRPGHGELADTGWTAPHVTALESVGVRAGEEIARWLVERLPRTA